MRKENDAVKKHLLRLCAALCVWLVCAGLLCPVPGCAAEPVPTPRMITRRPSPPVTPSPTPSPTEAPPVLVQVHYVTEKGSVLVSAGYPLKESGTVEADPDVVPEGYELAGETSCYVQVENGTASPDPVRFLIRKKPTPSPVPTQTPTPAPTGTPTPAPTETPVPEVFVPVYYVTENGSVLLRTECRLTASGTVRPDPEMVPDGFELAGETAVEVRLENGIANPSFVQFTVRRKMTPSPFPTPTPTPIPTSTPIPLSVSDFRTVGNIVRFGHYEQDNDTANGPEEIEWIVLDVQGNKALLLSRYGLDAKPYNTEYVDITWEKCTLRTWLNGKFMSSAFSPIEEGAVLTTAVDNSRSQGYSEWGMRGVKGGKNTQDKIFLLSYAEANKYLGVTWEDCNNMKSRASPTAYALQAGAWTIDSYKTADGTAAGWWWLRSPGANQDFAADVNVDGSLFEDYVNSDSGCVRPALWINLESDIF